jgi:hypothetical protein
MIGNGFQFNHFDWPEPKFMKHRTVSIKLKYTAQQSSTIKKSIMSTLLEQNLLPNHCIVYSNFRQRVVQFSQDLGDHLDTNETASQYDIITLVGTQFQYQKAKYINLFVSGIDTDQYRPRILCATSGVGNAGIDSPDIRSVYRMDFPPSIIDICQEKGRAGRRPGALPTDYNYTICFSLESFLLLFKRIHNPSETIIDESYRTQQHQDLMCVARLMISKTCLSIEMEKFLSNPLIRYDPAFLECCGACPVCMNIKLFPVIQRAGCCQILFDLFVSGQKLYDMCQNY